MNDWIKLPIMENWRNNKDEGISGWRNTCP